MNISEVGLLLNAGFTKDEIVALMGNDPQPSGDPAPDPEPAGDPAPDPEPSGSPAPDPEPSGDPAPSGELQSAVDGLQKTVNDLLKTVKAMQADNVKKASGGKAEVKTSEDVIKDFFSKS